MGEVALWGRGIYDWVNAILMYDFRRYISSYGIFFSVHGGLCFPGSTCEWCRLPTNRANDCHMGAEVLVQQSTGIVPSFKPPTAPKLVRSSKSRHSSITHARESFVSCTPPPPAPSFPQTPGYFQSPLTVGAYLPIYLSLVSGPVCTAEDLFGLAADYTCK